MLVIGSGPIVIRSGREFDYSGTQACKALRAEGLEVVLINSNPATIMTDPELAEATHRAAHAGVRGSHHCQGEARRRAAHRRRTGALNLAVALHERGILDKYSVNWRADRRHQSGRRPPALPQRDARDRHRGAEERVARTLEEALAIVDDVGFPAIIRPSFTLGGVGGIAYNVEEFRELAGRGLDQPRARSSSRSR